MQHTIVMTGASRGIGRIAAEYILRGSSETHLVVIARENSGGKLAAELAAAGGTVSHVGADLASLQSVRAAAGEIRQRLDDGDLPPLRGLVGNAGIQHTNAHTTGQDGLEATFTVNVLANHNLVRHLQDRFDAPARITITVSDTHFGDFKHNMGMVPGPVWQDPAVLARPATFAKPDTAVAGRTADSTSKLAAIYLVHECARQLPRGINTVAYNPGFVPGTDLVRDAGRLARFATRRIMPFMALTPFATSRAAAGRYLADVALGNIEATNGSYVDRKRMAQSSEESYNPQRERALWEFLERSVTLNTY